MKRESEASRRILARLLIADEIHERSLVRIRELQEAHKTAQMQGLKECCKSGICCWRRPGEISEPDVTEIATALGITEQQFFQSYLVVDRIRHSLFLRLRRANEQGGRMLNWRQTWAKNTPCVFLDQGNENACRIHAFKPAACRGYKCWEPSPNPQVGQSQQYLRSLGWDGTNPDDNATDDV
jgi:Fe-S-cluster containining protein